MFGEIAPRYDLANTALSFGIHRLWRRALLKMLPGPLPAPGRALDLCTGTGDLLPALHGKAAQVIGADFCMPMLKEGARRHGLNFPLVQADALKLPFADYAFSLITVAFGVRNFENLVDGLREMRRLLTPGGYLLVLEFGQPQGAFGAIFRFYSRFIMPMIGGLLTGNREAYRYLPETAAKFPCGERFERILADAGYKVIGARALTGGIAYCYCARRDD